MYVLRRIAAYEINSLKMNCFIYNDNIYALQNFVESTSEQFGFWSLFWYLFWGYPIRSGELLLWVGICDRPLTSSPETTGRISTKFGMKHL